jgi:hypothetical protein
MKEEESIRHKTIPKKSGSQTNLNNKFHGKAEVGVKETDIYQAKTPLGKRLMEIRELAIKEGMRLLSQEELDQEIAERKGFRYGKVSRF